MSQVVGLSNTHSSLSPIRHGFAPGFVNYTKGCTRLAAASDQVYQLLAHGRWISPGTPASSTTKTGRHDIAEILLKVTLNTINQIKSNQSLFFCLIFCRPLFVLMSFFFLQAIVLCIHIISVTSDYLCGIFPLLLLQFGCRIM